MQTAVPSFNASGEAFLHFCFTYKLHNACVLMLTCHVAAADGNCEDETEAAESVAQW